MSIRFKDDEGNIFYMSMPINCDQTTSEKTDDDYLKNIRCVAKKVNPECKTCSLANPNKPKYNGPRIFAV